MEQVTLATAVPRSSITTYKVAHLSLDVIGQVVEMTAISNVGTTVSRRVTGATAVSLMSQLNTANLSVKSLQKRVLEYMAAAGDFTGTISGTPD